MGKRKRLPDADLLNGSSTETSSRAATTNFSTLENGDAHTKKKRLNDLGPPVTPLTAIQVIVGTYDKVLHGFTASFSRDSFGESVQADEVEFVDTFLFNAHESAVRCLALSPLPSASEAAESEKIILASGSSDQTVNLYQISTTSPLFRGGKNTLMPALNGGEIAPTLRNKEIGSLQHHNASVNALQFPSRSKLLSAADDNTLAVTRTRDWTVLSTIKAPRPKVHGRPSGDTAAFGETPSGVNDFAVHPSMKLMVSVGKGEKCMRLWNLVTGKKAGALNFERALLQEVGEGRWGRGEGLKVEWNEHGEEFAIAFERGVVVFGLDSKPKYRALPSPPTKIHQIHYSNISPPREERPGYLAISTEDGRILFFATQNPVLPTSKDSEGKVSIPLCDLVGQIKGSSDSSTSRIKDFEILNPLAAQGDTQSAPIVIAASSNGSIWVWQLDSARFLQEESKASGVLSQDTDGERTAKPHIIPDVGRLIGTYETGHRITCLKAFVMQARGTV